MSCKISKNTKAPIGKKRSLPNHLSRKGSGFHVASQNRMIFDWHNARHFRMMVSNRL